MSLRSESDGGTTAKSYCPSVTGPTKLKAAAHKLTGARINLEVEIDKTQFESKKHGSFIRNDFAESDDELAQSVETTDEGLSMLGNSMQQRNNGMKTSRVQAVPEIHERSPPNNVKSTSRQLSQENKRLFTFSKQRQSHH